MFENEGNPEQNKLVEWNYKLTKFTGFYKMTDNFIFTVCQFLWQIETATVSFCFNASISKQFIVNMNIN